MIPGLLNGAFAGSVMGFTDTGYMKECLFQKYIKYFIHSIPPTCLVLLILDSYKKVESLNIKVNQLKAELKAIKDELATLKNSGICSLCLALNYKREKKKTMLFFKLLINEASLKLLKDVKKKAKKKANEIKQKKEVVIQKRIDRTQKKKELKCAREEKQFIKKKNNK
ncbi:15918_t:CDS:2 [Cetraspora pellucida]|uniref:15918_t:CDS:1 n=1 Tax=Cetraspora pellucida TaxID=1433469 RepID=A0A9N9G8U3_9GLOM|nr:15918_t:CDS:2 [Cetraspora pellucida]